MQSTEKKGKSEAEIDLDLLDDVTIFVSIVFLWGHCVIIKLFVF